MNLTGRAHPEPHPGWRSCADELLFYTSRYVAHTAGRLAVWAEGQEVRLDGFQAQRMSAAQRACMARLLSFPPDPYTARAVAGLAQATAKGEQGVPPEVAAIAGRCRSRPYLQVVARRPQISTGLGQTHPIDALRHLGRRYGFPVRVWGRRVDIDSGRTAQLITAGSPRVRRNMQEVLQALNRAGYAVSLAHLQHEHIARSA